MEPFHLSNVKLDLVPSPQALYNIKNIYDKDIYNKKTLFWLDAHWGSTPLFDELKYITTNFKKFCIFIDDFTIPYDDGFHTDGYDIETIKPYIMNKDTLKFYMIYILLLMSCVKIIQRFILLLLI